MPTTVTIEVPEALAARWAALPTETVNRYGVAALVEVLERAEREADEEAGVRRAIAGADRGRFRAASESAAEMRRRHDIPDLSHLSEEQLSEETERIIARLREESPERYARAVAEGVV